MTSSLQLAQVTARAIAKGAVRPGTTFTALSVAETQARSLSNGEVGGVRLSPGGWSNGSHTPAPARPEHSHGWFLEVEREVASRAEDCSRPGFSHRRVWLSVPLPKPWAPPDGPTS